MSSYSEALELAESEDMPVDMSQDQCKVNNDHIAAFN
jgi:hypothetical protein